MLARNNGKSSMCMTTEYKVTVKASWGTYAVFYFPTKARAELEKAYWEARGGWRCDITEINFT